MIYFCIPALNEERTVGVVLWKLRQVMTELQRDFQIIVVDDASTDATQQVLGPYARVLPLTLIRNPQQMGYAASMEIAIREAVRRSPYPKRDALITLQGDFTEDPEVVPALIKRVEAGADIVSTAVALDEDTPKPVRYARRLFAWLLRGQEWTLAGEPFSGFRAYRIMTVKRALEGRGSARLLSWEGWAANAELLAQTAPHSRRNDVVDSTLHYKRLQRASRFKFMPLLSQVMGVRSGKASKAEPVILPDTTLAVPAALAVELASSHRREEARRREASRGRREDPRRGRPGRTARPDRNPRSERSPRGERGARPERKPRPERTTRPQPAPAPTEEAPIVEAVAGEQPAPQRERKRRRSRRRSKKPAQPNQAVQETSVGETVEMPAAAAAPDGAEGGEMTAGSAIIPEGARKKSRRGRRGGRGRKRGARPPIDGQAEGSVSESPVPEPRDNAGEAAASQE